MKRILFLIVFSVPFLLTSQVKASVKVSFPADSLRVKWMDGKKYILHKVEPKETWTQIAKKYSIEIDELKAANNGILDLKIGQIINVPSPETSFKPATPSKPVTLPAQAPASTQTKPVTTSAPAPAKPAVVTTGSKTPIIYTVKQGETLYSISKRYEQNLSDIMTFNNLTSPEVKEGQKLIVGYVVRDNSTPKSTQVNPTPEPVIKSVPQTQTAKPKEVPVQMETAVIPSPTSTPNTFEKPTKSVAPIKKGNGGKTLMQITETGMAAWIKDGQLNQDKYYGLHRTAPIGTIMKVTNRMNNQSVYVKIVGVLPDTGENDNVVIKVSQAVSGKLNVLDEHFQAELSYGILQ